MANCIEISSKSKEILQTHGGGRHFCRAPLTICHNIFYLFYANDGEAVADGDDNFLYAGVGGDEVVEHAYALGLRVVSVGIEHFVGPEGVVGKNHGTWLKIAPQELIILHIAPLVGIDKNEVVIIGIEQRRQQFLGIARVQCHGLSDEKLSELIGMFGIDFDSVDMTAIVHTFGKTESRIAGESAEFEYAVRLYKTRKHHQQPSLDMVGAHTGIQAVQMRLPVKTMQLCGLGVDVDLNVVVLGEHRSVILRIKRHGIHAGGIAGIENEHPHGSVSKKH